MRIRHNAPFRSRRYEIEDKNAATACRRGLRQRLAVTFGKWIPKSKFDKHPLLFAVARSGLVASLSFGVAFGWLLFAFAFRVVSIASSFQITPTKGLTRIPSTGVVCG